MNISLVNSNYKTICALFNFSKAQVESSSDINKKNLIRMAKRGDKKPNIRTKIGSRLYSYIYKNSDCYDEQFTNKLKKIRPDWVLSQYEIANEKKKQLLEIAKRGKPRPKKHNHPLGANLGSYINKSQGLCYDPFFTKSLKKLRPDWFISQSEIANKKKQKLLEMAKKGKPRPKFKTELGRFLGEQTTKKRSKNEKFSKEIRRLRPDWFVTNAELNRQKLLKIAKSGAKKPVQKKTRMGMLLRSYIRNNTEFKKKLKKIRPDWFVSRSDIANMKKKKLLLMAKKGYKRKYDALGQCLCNYIAKGTKTYDPVFTRTIKKLRPDWFRK